MKYLVKNPLLLGYLKLFEAILPKSDRIERPQPKKILLSNLAHMGDVVVASSVLPLLKKRYPEAEISFLLGSWSKVVLEGHPLVTRFHVADHWKHNRSSRSIWTKMAHYVRTRGQAIEEIRKENYEWAIDLYPYFPNAIPLLWRAGVPCRIGYTSGGFGPLLTHPKDWTDKPQCMARYHADLLDEEDCGYPSLVAAPCPIEEADPFVVMHIGTGAPDREWPLAKWKKVVDYLADAKIPLYFTGKGKREKAQIEELLKHASHGISLCDQLSWQQLVALVHKAQLLISVETAIMHIASAFQTPNIVIAPSLQTLWRPDNIHCSVVDATAPAEHVLHAISNRANF